MYRENYINSLRAELLKMVSEHLTPVALKYGYSEVPLETNIKWRPQVLVLGNYSSGKSTLINDFLGAKIQATGQAPTDDSFTVITYDDAADDNDDIRITEERDGKFLLNDPEFPFENLKKHGQRFAAHFRLKKVNSPFLKNLALIDTPGMLDSITERDRGYNYQEIIGDLAQIADLVLVLFDPHKAGTVREAHKSLRETLPSRTFEDRVLYVLNRVDECASLTDLIRVYGTLCWNLSQMTGRKDIPPIRLTYSQQAAHMHGNDGTYDTSYLPHLDNQREELKESIQEAPHHRLDHLATFVETHSERLAHCLEALLCYRKRLLKFRLKSLSAGFLVSLLTACGVTAGVMLSGLLAPDPYLLVGGGALVAFICLLIWLTVVQKNLKNRFHRNQLKSLDDLTPLENQTRRDSWEAVKTLVRSFLEKSAGRFSGAEVRRQHDMVLLVNERGSKEIREALNELAVIRKHGPPEMIASFAGNTAAPWKQDQVPNKEPESAAKRANV